MKNRFYLIGLMGSGKSTVGKMLSGDLHIPFFDLDQIIEKNSDKSINEFFQKGQEADFRMKEKEFLHAISFAEPEMILAAGGGTPCFHENISFMKENGKVIYLRCSTKILAERLKNHSSNRPLLNSPVETASEILSALLDKRKSFYEQADIIIDSDKKPEEVCIELKKIILNSP